MVSLHFYDSCEQYFSILKIKIDSLCRRPLGDQYYLIYG